MLKKLKEEEFEQYIEFAYELAMDISHASFPVYTDGVKDKAFFYEVAENGIKKQHHEILLYEENEKVEGWIHYYYLDEDKYIGLNNFLVRNGITKALEELLEYWSEKFPGATWYQYFPEENTEALSFMKVSGIEDKGQEIVDVLQFDDYKSAKESDCVVPITRHNFEMFREIHRQYEGDMYWTSNKIEEEIENWDIYAYVQGEKCLGVVYLYGKGDLDLEIYGVDVPECDCEECVIESLLIGCLNTAKASGAKSMYYFVEKQIEHEIALKHGFKCITVAHYFEKEI